MNIIYSKKNYNIYIVDRQCFIIHNTKKKFEDGHTHIKNYNTAKYLINLCIHRSIPEKHLSDYLLESIVRLSTDTEYINQIKQKMRRV